MSDEEGEKNKPRVRTKGERRALLLLGASRSVWRVRLGELEVGGDTVGAEAGLEELADGLRGADTGENELAGGVADHPALGVPGAGVGAGGAALGGVVGGGSGDGGQGGDDDGGDLHDDGLLLVEEVKKCVSERVEGLSERLLWL